MNKGTPKRIAALLLLMAIGGCGTTLTEPSAYANQKPILSATEARTMIIVEVRELQPITVDDTVVVSANQTSGSILDQ